jgi:hypothetical protein
MRPHARRAVVLAAGRERGAVEGIDGGAIIGGDGDVQDAPGPPRRRSEVRLAAFAEAGRRASALAWSAATSMISA